QGEVLEALLEALQRSRPLLERRLGPIDVRALFHDLVHLGAPRGEALLTAPLAEEPPLEPPMFVERLSSEGRARPLLLGGEGRRGLAGARAGDPDLGERVGAE